MVVRNVTFKIISPDDWVVIITSFEEPYNVLGSCLNRLEPFTTKDACQMLLDSSDSIGSNVVTEDTE